MSVYNVLLTELACPRCGNTSVMEAELRFGVRDQIEYRLDDRYCWVEREDVQNGGRPVEGNLDGEGYVECPICRKDFFIVVEIRSDVITGVKTAGVSNSSSDGVYPNFYRAYSSLE